MKANNYIPRDILLQSKIRSLDDLEMKAAIICYENSNLRLSPVCQELGANYHKSWIRLRSLKERGEYTGLGRPPYITKSEKYKFEKKIVDEFKHDHSMTFIRLQQFSEEMYDKKIGQLTPEQREKRPIQLPQNYSYRLSERFDLKSLKPTQTESDRNQCATQQTILDFLN